MYRGYTKLWRKSLDSTVWKNPNLWRFWTWCMMKATHKETTEVVGYQEVHLMPGQLIFGRTKAAKETGLSEQTIRTCLVGLKKTQNLTIESTNKFSVLTIVKWEDYQQDNGRPTSKTTTNQPASNQLVTTNKNKDTRTQKEEEKNPPYPPQGGGAKYLYSKSFESFWEVYPKKIGKGAAYKAWQKVGKRGDVSALALLDAITSQVEAQHFTNQRGEDMVPNASTWLNQRRWEDELQTGKSSCINMRGDRGLPIATTQAQQNSQNREAMAMALLKSKEAKRHAESQRRSDTHEVDGVRTELSGGNDRTGTNPHTP